MKKKISGKLLKTSSDLKSALNDFEKSPRERINADPHSLGGNPDQEISLLRAALDKIKRQIDQFSEQ